MRLFIGEELESGIETYIDASSARSILACGKRGTGKSYPLGDIVEEIHTEGPDVVPLVIDPMGIYWTMSEKKTGNGTYCRIEGYLRKASP